MFFSTRMFFPSYLIVFVLTTEVLAVLSPPAFLTPLIKQNKTQEAKRISLVDPEAFLNVTSYSGFLTVNESYNSSLYFWYFPALNKEDNKTGNGSETPWIIWLQGGPGATSLVGLFAEMGPFEYDGQLKLRNTSWCRRFSMVFIDNPVGAGFSFTDHPAGYSVNMDMYSEHLYLAVTQLAAVYPELSAAPLYVAGESYAGRYVPGLAAKILKGAKNKDNNINLQGLIMGNPVLDRDSIVDYTRMFYTWGLVDSQGALAAKPLQDEYEKAVKEENSLSAASLRGQVLHKLKTIANIDETYNVLRDHTTTTLKAFVDFIDQTKIREALHVGNKHFDYINEAAASRLDREFVVPVSPMINELLEQYRVLIYYGQLDLTTPCVLNAEARRRKWSWSKRADFLKAARTPWWFNNTVAGYVKSGGGFTEVQVNGAGHLVPRDKPLQAFTLITSFILSEELPRPPSYEIEQADTPPYEEYKDLTHNETDFKNGFVASVVVNVMLVVGIALGVYMFVRWKRQNDFFYSPLSDGILTMT